MVLTVTIAVLAVFFLLALVWKHNRPLQVPENLLGRWTSTAPLYDERYFEITKVAIVFATGESTVSEYFFTGIEQRETKRDNEMLYSLDCEDLDGMHYNFSFFYLPENGGTIIFKNQKQIVWTKQKEERNSLFSW